MYFSFRYWHGIMLSLSHVAKNVKKLYGSFVQPLVPFKIFIVFMHGFVQSYVNEYKTGKMEIHWTRVNIELHAWCNIFCPGTIKWWISERAITYVTNRKLITQVFGILRVLVWYIFFKRLTSSGVMANWLIAFVAKLSGISDSKQRHVWQPWASGFTIRLVKSVFHLPDGQVNVDNDKEFNITEVL